MNMYEILKDCWINGKFYRQSQLIKLTESQAKEWLDRGAIKAHTKNKK